MQACSYLTSAIIDPKSSAVNSERVLPLYVQIDMENNCQRFNVFGLVPVTLPLVSFCVNPCTEDRFCGALQIMVIPHSLMYCCALMIREIKRTLPLRKKIVRPATSCQNPSCQKKASGRLLLILMVIHWNSHSTHHDIWHTVISVSSCHKHLCFHSLQL